MQEENNNKRPKMKPIPCEKLGRLVLMTTIIVLANGMVIEKIQAKEVDLNVLCTESPQNARCKGNQRDSQAQDSVKSPEVKIFKVKLDSSGSNEWIRIEMSRNTMKFLHTTRTIKGISRLISIFAPFPPLYTWHDHQTTRVVFEPDNCSGSLAPSPTQPSSVTSSQSSSSTATQPSNSQSCSIVGTDMVNLPEGIDLYKGMFTVNYTERKLLRSISFRIPEPKKNS